MHMIRKVAAYIILVNVYGLTLLMATVGRIIPRRRWKPNGRILITGTFFNPNWYLSHITPLVHSGLGEVILVVDKPQQPMDGVRFICPPKCLAKLISRAGAKSLWMVYAAIRYRPDLCMGYYIVPGACSALIAGRLIGRPSCYQMTAGPVEVVGGGFKASGSFSSMLGSPSRVIQSLALKVTRLFDLVVVRGNKAKEFLRNQCMNGSVAAITGSVDSSKQMHSSSRDIDIVFVGRLVITKQPHQLIEVVEQVSKVLPSVKAVIVGEGPLMEKLKSQVHHAGLAGNIEFLGKREDVEAILARSRVFVLTSISEGLSIAMAEAMSIGVVPVVADVGELCDLVVDGKNGYLVEPNNIGQYANRVASLLKHQDLWERQSKRAIKDARAQCEIEVVSGKWRNHLGRIVSESSGLPREEILD